MAHEIEVKYLNVDPAAIERKLLGIGARKVGEYFYRRRVFDFPDLRLNAKGAWVRVRDEGERVTMSYKQRLGITTHDGTVSDSGMEEHEVIVSDFDATCEILKQLGLVEKFYQENRRIRYELNDVEFDTDTWPKLDPYLEIEGASWEAVDRAAQDLGLDVKDRKIFSTHQIYALAGIDELEYERMAFDGFTKRS